VLGSLVYIGEIDFSVPDEDLIEVIFDELSPLQNQGVGEYVFKSDIVAEVTLWRCPYVRST